MLLTSYRNPPSIPLLRVTAVNYKTFVVSFNQALDATEGAVKANYTVSGTNVSGNTISKTVADVVLADDKKSTTVVLAAGSHAEAGDKLTVTVKKGNSAFPTEGVKSSEFAVAVDSAIPQITSVSAIGNKIIKIGFSEPVTNVTTDSFEFKTAAQTSYTTQASTTAISTDLKTVTITLDNPLAIGGYDVRVVTGTRAIKDFADFKVASVAKTFAIVEATKVANAASLTVVDRLNVKVAFDSEITSAPSVSWKKADGTVVSANGTIQSDNKTVKVAFGTALAVGTTEFTVSNANDANGNAVPTAKFSGTVVANPSPTFTVKQVTDSQTQLEVVFSAPMYNSEDAKGNAQYKASYVITKPAGTTAAATGVTVNSTTKVTLTFDTLAEGSYKLTISDVKDAVEVAMTSSSQTIAIVDKIAPTTVAGSSKRGVLASGKKVVVVAFDEPMAVSGANSILDLSNYKFNGSLTFPADATVTAGTSDKSAIITYTSTDSVTTISAGYFDGTKVKTVGDKQGNLLVPANVVYSGDQAAFALSSDVNKIKIVDGKTIELTLAAALASVDKADFIVSTTEVSSSLTNANNTYNTKVTTQAAASASLKDDGATLVLVFAADTFNANTTAVSVKTQSATTSKSTDVLGQLITSNSTVNATTANSVTNSIQPALASAVVIGSGELLVKFTGTFGTTLATSPNAADFILTQGTSAISVSSITTTATVGVYKFGTGAFDITQSLVLKTKAQDYITSVGVKSKYLTPNTTGITINNVLSAVGLTVTTAQSASSIASVAVDFNKTYDFATVSGITASGSTTTASATATTYASAGTTYAKFTVAGVGTFDGFTVSGNAVTTASVNVTVAATDSNTITITGLDALNVSDDILAAVGSRITFVPSDAIKTLSGEKATSNEVSIFRP